MGSLPRCEPSGAEDTAFRGAAGRAVGDLGKGAAGLEAKGLSFAFAVVDEPQDVRIGQLRLLATLLGKPPNGLFFAGDSGQRIFQAAFFREGAGSGCPGAVVDAEDQLQDLASDSGAGGPEIDEFLARVG